MSHGDFNEELNALREKLPEAVEETGSSKTIPQVFYSIDVAERIVDAYAQGKSLYAISKQGEMPAYSTLIKWAKSHPEFSKMLRAVRESRALHFESAAIEAAENAQGKDGDRLRFDAYKWGAEVNDPSTYGKKVQATHEVGGKVTFQVITGFGPPNAWQTSPKLNADGTIEKAVACEVVKEEPPSEAPGPSDPERGERNDPESTGREASEARSPDDPHSGESGEPCGVPALPPEPGHPPGDGSA